MTSRRIFTIAASCTSNRAVSFFSSAASFFASSVGPTAVVALQWSTFRSRMAPAAAVGSQQFDPVITSSLDGVSIFCRAAAFHIFHWASFGVAICCATGNAQPNANVPPLSLNRE
jgi:hypothetical protein